MEQNELILHKVLNPMSVVVAGHTATGKPRHAQMFLRVEIKRKTGVDRLSISGVVGPRTNGNAAGSCGQITDELLSKGRKLNGEWTPQLVRQLYNVWNTWHLNDMKAGTIRQTEYLAGVQTKGERLSYDDACDTLKAAGMYADEEFWWNATKREQYTPTDDDTALWGKFSRFDGEDFQPFAKWCVLNDYTYPGAEPYRYGHGWLVRELPADVVEFLQALPETRVTPAWV